MTKTQEIGHEHLEFWGACCREREGDGVYATWTSIRHYSPEQIGAAAVRSRRARPSDPPAGLVRFVAVEFAFRSYPPGAVSVRGLAVHVYVLQMPMSRYSDAAVSRALVSYGVEGRGVNDWYWARITDLRERVGKQAIVAETPGQTPADSARVGEIR